MDDVVMPGSSEDPIVSLIAALKAEARAAGLTDKDIDAELATYKAEPYSPSLRGA